MNQLETFRQAIPVIEERLGYHFHDEELLILAFIHRSFVNEHRDLVQDSNERLEFLGDSVLGMLVAKELYATHPKTLEGQLSHMRALLVQASACADYIELLELGSFVLVGKGEQMSEGRGRESVHADLFEAIIGAIYLDGGLGAASDFLFNNLREEMASRLARPERNWKALLQDYAQRTENQTPLYEIDLETGPDHRKHFVIRVSIAGKILGIGEGNSKKQAQQRAARAALQTLENI